MTNFTNEFKENVSDVKFYITVSEKDKFSFAMKYKEKTGDFIFGNPSYKIHSSNSSKWSNSVKITFNSNEKYIKKLKNMGYSVTKQHNKYKISDVKLFWKLIDAGWRI